MERVNVNTDINNNPREIFAHLFCQKVLTAQQNDQHSTQLAHINRKEITN